MKRTTLLLVCWFWTTLTFAQEFPEKPASFVNDYANILNDSEEAALNSVIRQIADSTSNEIAVAIFTDAQGYELSDFGLQVARTWGIGNKERNNGVLIALFMKERGYSFQVGRGLEPVLTDLSTRRIFDQYMKPAFRKGEYYRGLEEAVVVTGQIASGEFAFSGEYGKGNVEGKDIIGVIILILIFLGVLMIFLARRGGGGGGNRVGGLGAALPYLFLASQMGHRSHSGWGGGGFGGGSGGGFGGFGGGSFGGGGSSGSW